MADQAASNESQKQPEKPPAQLPVPNITPNNPEVRLIYPQRYIPVGTGADGNPVYVDCKDLIPTEAQKEEQSAKMAAGDREAAENLAAHTLAQAADLWMAQRLLALCPKWMSKKILSGDIGAREELRVWAAGEGLNFIDVSEDTTLKLILRRGDKPLSEFKAKLEKM